MNKTLGKFKKADVYEKIWIIFVIIPFLTMAIYAIKLLLGVIGLGVESPGSVLSFSFGVAYTIIFAVVATFIAYIIFITLANSFDRARKTLFGVIALLCAAAFLIIFQMALLSGLGVTEY